MELDFNTYGVGLRNAVDSVLNGELRWIILGYVSSTHTLNVISQGEKVHEFLDKFILGRTLFGFARVSDLKIGPLKFVFISWQGEGSSESLKTYYARHSDLVKRFCRTVHFTVHATNETDLDWSEIVANTIGTTSVGYNENNDSFAGTNHHFDEDIDPVGTNYEPIKPKIDSANVSSSRKFWQSKQNEQKTRPAPPILKAQKPFQKSLKFPSSNYGSPKIGTSWNSNTITATYNSNNNNGIKQVGQISRTFIQNRVKAFQSVTPTQVVKKPEVVNKASAGYRKIDPQAEIMLARKLNESASLEDLDNVGTKYERTNAQAEIRAARASKSNGVTEKFPEQSKKYERTNAEAEIRAARATLSNGSENSVPEQSRKYEYINALDEIHAARVGHLNGSAFKYGQVSTANSQSNPSSTSDSGYAISTTISNNIDQFRNMNSHLTALKAPEKHIYSEESVQNTVITSTINATTTTTTTTNTVNNNDHQIIDNNDYSSFITPMSFNRHENISNLTAVCLYDYTANENDELSFHAGDRIHGIEQIDDGWWVGSDSNGQIGLFPANYVELIA